MTQPQIAFAFFVTACRCWLILSLWSTLTPRSCYCWTYCTPFRICAFCSFSSRTSCCLHWITFVLFSPVLKGFIKIPLNFKPVLQSVFSTSPFCRFDHSSPDPRIWVICKTDQQNLTHNWPHGIPLQTSCQSDTKPFIVNLCMQLFSLLGICLMLILSSLHFSRLLLRQVWKALLKYIMFIAFHLSPKLISLLKKEITLVWHDLSSTNYVGY